MKKKKSMTMIGQARRQESTGVSLQQQLLRHDDREVQLLLLPLLPVLAGLQQQGCPCVMPHCAIAPFWRLKRGVEGRVGGQQPMMGGARKMRGLIAAART